MIARLLRAFFGKEKATGPENPAPTYEDKSVYRTMDALPKQLCFELDDLRLVEMQMRHMAFEMTAMDAAMELLGLERPLKCEECQGKIEAALLRIRAGEELACDDVAPATALGVLWGWTIVLGCGWKWRAAGQNGWETLAVCDAEHRHLILPIQYIREIAEGDGASYRLPAERFKDVRDLKLPASPPNALKRIC